MILSWSWGLVNSATLRLAFTMLFLNFPHHCSSWGADIVLSRNLVGVEFKSKGPKWLLEWRFLQDYSRSRARQIGSQEQTGSDGPVPGRRRLPREVQDEPLQRRDRTGFVCRLAFLEFLVHQWRLEILQLVVGYSSTKPYLEAVKSLLCKPFQVERDKKANHFSFTRAQVP